MATDGVLHALISEANAGGRSFAAWGVAWARVLPTVLAVPAFGLSLVPLSLRIAMGFVLAMTIAPAVSVTALPLMHGSSWPLGLVKELILGTPPAIAASVALWAAVVAGGVADATLDARRWRAPAAGFGRDATPLSALLGWVAIIAFLNTGGVTRLAAELVLGPTAAHPFARAATDLAAGVGIGASIGAPLLVVSLLVNLATGVAAREHPSLRGAETAAPLRALVLLVAAAALFDRMAAAVALLGRG